MNASLLIISAVYDVGLLALSVFWLFTTQTYFDKCCPVFLLPLLACVVVAFSRKRLDKTRSANIIKMNLATLGLIISIAAARYYWDFNFILYRNEYSSALEVIKSSYRDVPHNKSYEIDLPSQYENLSYEGKAYIRIDKNDVSVIFPLGSGDLDGILDAYLYAIDKQDAGLPNICNTGHPINPPNQNWFYCTAGERQMHE